MAELSQVDVSTHRKIGGKTKTQSVLERVGHELKVNPPSVLASTRRKYGPVQAAKQKTAILLSKARKAGASIPRAKSSKGVR